MRLTFALAGACCAFLVMTGCQSTPKEKEDVDSILVKMKSAIDPDGRSGAVDTEVTTSTVKNSDGKPVNLVVKIKFPDKIRIEATTVDGVFVKACNAAKGWEFSSKSGVREITGAELGALRFQVGYLSVKKSLKEMFTSIVVSGEETVNDRPCYKLLCTPRPDYGTKPLTAYVDKATYLVQKTEEYHTTPTGFLFMERFLNDFRNMDGFIRPNNIITVVGGKIIEINTTSVEWNHPLEDSEFATPEKLDK